MAVSRRAKIDVRDGPKLANQVHKPNLVRSLTRLARGLGRDQLLERGLVADRVEIRVALRKVAELLRHPDCLLEVLERIGCPAGEALAAGEVVEEQAVVSVVLGRLA